MLLQHRFRERSISPYNKSCTVILSPAVIFSLEPPVPAAFFDIVTTSDKLLFSNTIIDVIIFVVDAIALFCVSFFAHITSLVVLSYIIAALAFNVGSSVGFVTVSIVFFIKLPTI